MLWGHDAGRERRLVVEPDSEGRARLRDRHAAALQPRLPAQLAEPRRLPHARADDRRPGVAELPRRGRPAPRAGAGALDEHDAWLDLLLVGRRAPAAGPSHPHHHRPPVATRPRRAHARIAPASACGGDIRILPRLDVPPRERGVPRRDAAGARPRRAVRVDRATRVDPRAARRAARAMVRRADGARRQVDAAARTRVSAHRSASSRTGLAIARCAVSLEASPRPSLPPASP